MIGSRIRMVIRLIIPLTVLGIRILVLKWFLMWDRKKALKAFQKGAVDNGLPRDQARILAEVIPRLEKISPRLN